MKAIVTLLILLTSLPTMADDYYRYLQRQQALELQEKSLKAQKRANDIAEESQHQRHVDNMLERQQESYRQIEQEAKDRSEDSRKLLKSMGVNDLLNQ
jgi:uncharacterized membrane protein YgaE (UPF0421/DUF939 family)